MCAVSALFAAVSAAVLCGCSERVVKIKFDDFYADGGDGLAAIRLHTTVLRIAVTPVTAGGLTLFMRHDASPSLS